jgi:hypothetical protein
MIVAPSVIRNHPLLLSISAPVAAVYFLLAVKVVECAKENQNHDKKKI